MNKVQPHVYLSGKLRENIPDPNPNRTSNWIYPDRPMIMELSSNINNFPRISVTPINYPSTISDLGMASTEQQEQLTISINIWCYKTQILSIDSVDSETHTYDGSSIYKLNNVPFSLVTEIADASGNTYINGTDYKVISEEIDGLYDAIEWIGSTPDDGEDFYVSYERRASCFELAEYIAQQVHEYIRDNWRNDLTPKLYDYQKTGMNKMKDLGDRICRIELTVQFSGINVGD